MKPEEKARLIIDKKLADAGWQVVDRNDYLPSVSAVAVREGVLQGNLEVDYLLFLSGKAIGVVEAKKENTVLSDVVAGQAEKYARKLLNWYPCWRNPLPLVYLSNGKELLFRNISIIQSEYQTLQRMHTPCEMTRITCIQSEFAGLPYLSLRGLRKCQYEAITQLENSFARDEKRALMALATGAGKTFTACMTSYRLLSYTPVKRILFLVDRNNLGKQAEGEFGTFRLTETGDPFNTIFVVERLKSPHIPPESNVVISTIQRIFAVLTGQEITEDEDFEDDLNYHNDNTIELGNQLNLPSDFFDIIIVDECHRSIYGCWQKVLTYFDKARIIGLTATPVPETMAFFNNNLVINYTLEKSIADGINVDYRVYRITTKVSDEGGIIKEGDNYREYARYTQGNTLMAAEDILTFGNKELDRSVINPAQIRLVLDAFRDAIYSELFPEREPTIQFIPKTLIFAKNDDHATRIVEIVRETFPNQSPDFAQKITYSAGDSAKLIRDFRNDKLFRIAVTVNLVATGTDIKPLEILVFMREVTSAPLYMQMKGRGVRTIGDEQLRTVTPNATSKDLFYLVDAVGVTESEKFVPKQGEDILPANPTLEQLLEKITYGYLSDEYLRLLASRLSRISAKSEEKRRFEFANLAGITMYDLAKSIFNAFESENNLPEFNNSNEPNSERKALVVWLANNPEARKYLLVLNAGFVKILIPGEDELIYTGFSKEEAISTTQAFEKYANTHKDEIEALRIIYNNQRLPITYAMLVDLKHKLLAADVRFKQAQLWNFYSIVNKGKVVQLKKNERELLTNLIQLVRYAFGLITDLRSLPSLAAQRYELWCGQNQRPLTEIQKEIVRQIVDYIVANGSYTNEELREENVQVFAQLVKNFGSTNAVEEMLGSLSGWILAS